MHPIASSFDLEAFDTIQIRTNAPTKVVINFVCANAKCPTAKLEGPHSAYIVPPNAPSTEEAAILQPFFQEALGEPTVGTVRMGASHLYRKIETTRLVNRLTAVKNTKAGSDPEVPVSGSLRSLPSLGAPEAFLLTTGKGLALGWAGGTPPYEIATEVIATGDSLGEKKSSVPFAWWPDWAMPSEPVTVVVTDASGHSLQGRLLPATALPSGQSLGSTAAVISLFRSGDNWRMEALRHLAAMASSDTLAAQALAAIRLSATGQDQ
jgi:hypothetical protein